jgi:hypothetical protein
MGSHSRGKCIPKILALLLVLMAAIAFLPAIAGAQVTPKKLTAQDVIDLLTGDVSSADVAKAAQKSGISFQVTAAVAKQIRDAGGTEDLIRVLRTLAPRPPAAPAGTPHNAPPASPPVLMIESSPGQSQVYLDDEPMGTTSQEGRLKLTRLAAGDHRVRISLSGYQDYEETVTLAAGEVTTVAATLQKPSAPATSFPTPSPQTEVTPPANPGQAGYLGVQAMDPQPAGARGVVISGAYPGTPAEQAGLKAYDTILAVNGRQVATLQDVHNALAGHQVGELVQVTWFNGSRNVTQQIQLVAAPATGQPATQPSAPPSLSNMPHNGFMSFTVAHDHQQNAANYCVGLMSIGNGMIYYKGIKGNGPIHTFEIPLSTVREARRNLAYLVKLGAFHIRLKKGTNYNFVVVNQQNQPQPPDALLEAIDRAMGK